MSPVINIFSLVLKEPLSLCAVVVFADYVEMWIVMVSMVSGCLMYTVLVANATTMIANIDPAAKEYKSKVEFSSHHIILVFVCLNIQLPLSSYKPFEFFFSISILFQIYKLYRAS